MIPDKILLRYGEIFLKGKNRNNFERKLITNIKKMAGSNKILKLRSRLITDYFPDHDRLKVVFGLTSYSPAFVVEKDAEKVKQKALRILKSKKGTFRVETKRSDKSFPTKSPEMNVLVGEFIEKNSKLKFSFNNPEIVLKIEINQQGAYLFLETIKCFGGLPTGVEGIVHLLVEDEASLLAGLQFMKRGCDLSLVAFGMRDISLLQKFSPKRLKLNAINNLEEIKKSVLVSGQNFKHFKEYKTDLIVMRPLIAYSDERVMEELNNYI